ncbi:MAG: hypothetical protein B0D92_04495 [Spirochaeta sp. LUC14_002_19_P3]|nr:MAG: hypothetical protein B0D92_04495 [Spirochaeta sp. LUC14_002_19_P3]
MVPGFRILAIESRANGKYPRVISSVLPGETLKGQEAVLFPGQKRVRLKELKPLAGGKAALTLKGAAAQLCTPGAVLLDPAWPVHQHREALLLFNGAMPADGEMSGGVTPLFNCEGMIGKARFRREGALIAVSLPAPYPMLPGMRVSLPDCGRGQQKTTLLYPGTADKALLKRLNAAAGSLLGKPIGVLYNLLLSTVGFQELPPNLLNYRFTDGLRLGKWVILEGKLRGMEKYLLRQAAKPGGVRGKRIRLDALPGALLGTVAENLERQGKLCRRGEWYFPPGEPRLSPFHRSWLTRVNQAGENGFRVRDAFSGADSEALAVLGRTGFIHGGRALWFSAESLASLSARLLSASHPGDCILVAEAKTKIGGSRTRVLELLAILEANGTLKLQKDGVTRVVI